MANLYQNTIEAVQHLPTEMENPVMSGVVAGVIVGAGYIAKQHHLRTHEKGAYDASGNGELISASQIGTEKRTARQRFSPAMQLFIGATLVGVHFVAQPTYEATFPDAEAEVMVVSDVSSSMVFTEDLGKNGVSRYEAAVLGIQRSEYQGSLGIAQTGARTQIISKQTTGWRSVAASIDVPKVDSNGGALLPALEQAATLFTQDQETEKRNGTIVIISDGTVNETREQITAKMAELEDEGLTVRAVVPGTSDGTYTLPQTTKRTTAGTKPDIFASLGKNVKTAKTVEDVIKTVKEEIKSAGTRRERKDWPILGLLGSGIAALGVGRMLKRISNKD